MVMCTSDICSWVAGNDVIREDIGVFFTMSRVANSVKNTISRDNWLIITSSALKILSPDAPILVK